MAMTMLMDGVRSWPSLLRMFVRLSADMPMRVRARRPGRQQRDADQQSNRRSGLAQTIQHGRERSRRDCHERTGRMQASISEHLPQSRCPRHEAY